MEKAFEKALQHHQAGRLDEAEKRYRAILAKHPDFTLAYHNLGVVLLQKGRYQDALPHLERARTSTPAYLPAHINAGHAQLGLGRPDLAMACFRDALAIEPGNAQTLFHLGTASRAASCPEDAATAFGQAARLAPQWSEPLRQLGLAELALGRTEQALKSLRGALALAPNDVSTLNSLALLLAQHGEADEAAMLYRRAITLLPQAPELYCNLGALERERGRNGDSLEILTKGAALAPESAEIQNNLGLTLARAGRRDEAVAAYGKSLALAPNSAPTLANLGNVLKEMGRIDDAIRAYAQAATIDIDLGVNQLFLLHQTICRWDHFDQIQSLAVQAVKRGARNVSPFSILATDTTPQEQLSCARVWSTRWRATTPLASPSRQRATPDKMKIGYLSRDFQRHAVGYLLPDMFECHDRSRFELFAYSYGRDDASTARKRIVCAVDHFVDLKDTDTDTAAQRIFQDGIDILIDLTGFTADGRPQIAARRPAPIQVSYLGFPGSMGAPFIDYVIVDGYLAPPGFEAHYSERLVRLPDCYLPSDRSRHVEALTRATCGLPEGAPVLCCFNNSYKITPTVFTVWANILKAVPNALLWLSVVDQTTRQNLTHEATARGIAPERLLFADFAAYETYLGRMALADLFLDSFPYNAGATANDALWAGLPLLTCSGQTYVSRMAGSQLHAIGLSELVTTSLSDYEALAIRLLQHPAHLTELRAKLTENKNSKPLFDMVRYTKNLEDAYRRIWHDQASNPD